MTIVLDSKPATAEDVAKILGVPKSRVKWLKRLAEARTIGSGKKQGRGIAGAVARKKTEGSKRRIQTRGKGKKSAH